MKVILLQDVKKIGKKFEIKNIADGHALNFLIPKKFAVLATPNAIKEIEKIKNINAKTSKLNQEKLMEELDSLNNSDIDIQAKVNETGHLFAGIGKTEIIQAIKDQKAIDIEPEYIILEKPIKEAQDHSVKLKANGKNISINIKIVPIKG